MAEDASRQRITATATQQFPHLCFAGLVDEERCIFLDFSGFTSIRNMNVCHAHQHWSIKSVQSMVSLTVRFWIHWPGWLEYFKSYWLKLYFKTFWYRVACLTRSLQQFARTDVMHNS